MNENLDLCEILKDCPKGTKFWTSLWGDVSFSGIKEGLICITVILAQETEEFLFLKTGKFYNIEDAECIIFPSKDQRDWSKFKVPIKRFNPKVFQTFNKVLVRDGLDFEWLPYFFEKLLEKPTGGYWAINMGSRCSWKMCIPYNDDTKHLCGTSEDCPEYYKWWEE